MSRNYISHFKKPETGLTLVEILISMALMSLVMLSISNFMMTGPLRMNAVGDAFKMNTEIYNLLQDLRADLHRGAYFSPNSFKNRFEYTTHDPITGDAVKKVYGICYYTTQQNGNDTTCPLESTGGTYRYLKLSTDGGATWGSPYRISRFHKYRFISGTTPMFLYAYPNSYCLNFLDNNGNGILESGETASPVTCSNYSATTKVPSSDSQRPQYTSKVVLSNFSFTNGTGKPEATRVLPQYIFIAAAPGLVRSETAPIATGGATGVKDSQLVQSFSFNSTVNSLWPSGFTVGGLSWDTVHERLIIGNSTHSILYTTERNGVFINAPYTLSASAQVLPKGIAIENDGYTLHVLNGSGSDSYYQYNLSGFSLLQASRGPFAFQTNQQGKIHLAFDPSTRNLYAPVYDTVDTKYKIQEFNGTDSTAPGTKTSNFWQLPAAFDGQSKLGGLAIDYKTGDFIVLQNETTTIGASKYIRIYRIARADATATSFLVNLTDLGSSATGTNGGFGLAYDPDLNRLFLADNVEKKIYEVAPVTVITAR